MHTLHTTIILNLRLKGFVTIWEFTLLFFTLVKLHWLLFLPMLTFSLDWKKSF